MPWTPLCELNELTEGSGKFVSINQLALGVYLDAGNVYIIDDRCPHAGASLSAGSVQNGCAVCPRHDWAFRLADGRLSDSDYVRVRAYAVRLVTIEGKSTIVEADLPLP